jgi:hypothetical protein
VDPNPTGGTPFTPGNTYTYRWSNGLTTPDLNNVQAGTYSVTITDKSNCKADTTVTVTQPPVITLSSSSTNVNCRGQATCAINLSVVGGTPRTAAGSTPYSYSWTGPNVVADGNTATPTLGAAGQYTLTVVDNATGCSSTSTLDITSDAVIAALTPDVINVGIVSTTCCYQWSLK